MTVRTKAILIIGAILASLLLAFFATSSSVLLNSFAALEEQDTRQNVERALDALNAELATLDSKAGDWANWDDTYNFIVDRNPEYIATNPTDTTFIQLDINFILLINTSGELVFGKGFDLAKEEEVPVPSSLREEVAPGSPLLQHPGIQHRQGGLVLLPEGPLLLASRPILTSDGEGPIRGTLIFARFLDASLLQRISETTHLSLSINGLDDPEMPAQTQAALPSLLGGGHIFVQPRDANLVAGYTILQDVYGEPALVMQVDLPRTIYRQGLLTVQYLLGFLLLIGLVFGIATMAIIERFLLSRIFRLNADVQRIGAEGNPSARLGAFGVDEVGSLALAVNSMLTALERAQEEVRRSRDELEMRVQERTAELARANEALRLEITQREIAEEALRSSEKRFRALIENSSDAVTLVSPEGNILYTSPPAIRILGYGENELIGKSAFQLLHPDDLQFATGLFAQLLEKPNGSVPGQFRYRRKDGSFIWVEAVGTNLLAEPAVQAIVVNYRDVTDRKRAEELIQSQLQRLAALRAIDMAITASLDLRVTLNVFLDQATTQLGADAADVLWLNPHTQTLEYAAGRGFRTMALQQTRLRLGEGHAGRAALERKMVMIPDMAQVEDGFRRSPLLPEEGFVSYYAAPLIAKGLVKGVLEVFRRTPLDPDQEWLDFLEALAGQAAIAIDNASLFDDLQRSNLELTLAYDTTIEGWSKALDLRDEETEGHTQRVTEMTLRLAREVGIREEEMVHIRRGALLHDMGKMGVPDRILLKPGPLTDEEWAIMRKHPQYAYDMLSPIAYLRPALDIPYAHHEKWDGTGYPRGLKGEQIPLAARLFALADVWDAVRSDRPYRKAWPKEKALEYIKEQAGKHFDPEQVPVFLHIVEEE